MPKYRVDITANDAESAENIMKVVHTAVETNPSLDLESVKVTPEVTPPDNASNQQTERAWKVVNG
jgi:translation initiation factor 2 alpha subunit (eIF-2alpha)